MRISDRTTPHQSNNTHHPSSLPVGQNSRTSYQNEYHFVHLGGRVTTPMSKPTFTASSASASGQNVSSTRVCIKNLPPRFTESQLKQHILDNVTYSDGKSVRVNDVRVLMRNGKSRRVAFIGFAESEMAESCISLLNGTYCGMAKISVEAALSKINNKKASDDTQIDNMASPEKKSNIIESRTNKDDVTEKKKQEFLAAMAPRHSKKFWENDDGINARETRSDDDNDDTKETSKVYSGDESSDDNSSCDNFDDVNELAKGQELDKDEDYSSSRLFLRNLPYTATESNIRELFDNFGTINEIHIPVDDRHQNKGFAFVEFNDKLCCKAAREALDGSDFMGRLLHVLPARARPANETIEGDNNITYKQKKLLQMHQGALTSTIGHNASHLRTDTVVHSLADSLNVNKSDILDIESGNVAVRVALGEAKVIEENKKWCIEQGINLEALDSKVDKSFSRSNTAILVKNVPYGDSTKEDLFKLFGSFSDSIEVLLPPSKSLALVKFSHGNDAKKAFKRLAYKRFKHVPLYLEWAPIINELQDSNGNQVEAIKTNTSQKATSDVQNVAEDDDDNDDNDEKTVFVKNLNFKTTEIQLKEIFEQIANVRAVRIPIKKGPQNDSSEKHLSMGYGFVEFSSNEDAKKAIKLLNGKLVQGHMIDLKLSAKSIVQQKVGDKSLKKNTKIMVRNVPFQTTRVELLQLFGSFGQLKRVRLPKKFDGTPRGFAFVDFVTYNEAQKAMEGLSKTHLYGRHLVLEWAEQEESVDDLREKAKRDIAKSKLAESRQQNKKIRFHDDYEE